MGRSREFVSAPYPNFKDRHGRHASAALGPVGHDGTKVRLERPNRFSFRSVSKPSITLTKSQARRIWIRAQRLDETAPFGKGVEAVNAAVAHLGYVQIDTINVIERCHHHILFTRIPDYRRADLRQAQSAEKSVFEYWTHALSYV